MTLVRDDELPRVIAGTGIDRTPRTAPSGVSAAGELPVRVTAAQWTRMSPVLATHRLVGLTVAAVEADELELEAEAEKDLFAQHRQVMLLALALERELVALTETLEAAGVDAIALKGPVLANHVYPDPAWRPFVDIDLLVRTEDWQRALEVLADAGVRRATPEPARGFDVRFGKAALHRSATGLQVDVHRTLVLGPFGLWMVPDELFEHATSFVLGGRWLRRLDDSDLLVNACVHAVLGSWPPLLLPLRDVVQICLGTKLDWEQVRARAAGWRLGLVVQEALTVAARTLGVDLGPQLRALGRIEATSAERRALRVHTSPRRGRGGTALSTMWAIPGLGNRAAYVKSLVFPDRAFVRAVRGESGAGAYVRRWATPIGWVLRRQKLSQ